MSLPVTPQEVSANMLRTMGQWSRDRQGSPARSPARLPPAAAPRPTSPAPVGEVLTHARAVKLQTDVGDIVKDNNLLQSQLTEASKRSQQRVRAQFSSNESAAENQAMLQDGQLAHFIRCNDELQVQNQELRSVIAEMSEQLRHTNALSQVSTRAAAVK